MRNTIRLLAFLAPAALGAQAANYPALQPSRVVEREYNFALADFRGGTVLLAQWREALNSDRLQFTGEGGIVDTPADAAIALGGFVHYQLHTANSQLPFDMALGGGIGLVTGNGTTATRIPFGVAIGRRFPLEQGYAITPFVHPRLAFSRARVAGIVGSETDVELDLGANFELNRQMQVRLALGLGDGSGVGLSFAWIPPGLRR